MGRATIEITRELLNRLYHNDYVSVERVSEADDGIMIVTVESPLLPHDCKGHQELIVEGDRIRFKPWADT